VNGDVLNSRSLLVIDPERSVHEFLKDILQREDRTFQDAYSLPDAEAFLRAAPYDVVLAGQGRNGHDGRKMVRRVHTLQPDARVILTGDSAPTSVIQAIRARVFGYCHNPPAAGPLSDIVQQALDASSWRNDIVLLSARPEWIAMDVRCKMEAGDRATHFLRELLADLPTSVREDVTSAFRELLFNAIEHGGECNPKKRVRVWIQRTPKALIVHIQDPGKGFSLNSLPHAAISNPADSPIHHVEVRAEAGQRPGGFGILMTRNLIDELIYNERGNAVLFVKYL
jgi:DNA-binding NarL/FixJ family response regulator